MRIEAFPSPEAAAAAAAAAIAAAARAAVESRGRFTVAVSGGHTPWIMLRALAGEAMPWDQAQLFQVDERIAPDGDADRNLTHLKEALLEHCPLPSQHMHPMPVNASDLDAACVQYAELLREYAGSPPVLDVVHLGMGPDGHTASLVPWDPVLDVVDRDVAVTEPYEGRRRMTLTYPVLNRARTVLWLVTGEEKAGMVSQLVQGDRSIPAGRVAQNHAFIIADRGAIMQLAPHDVVLIG